MPDSDNIYALKTSSPYSRRAHEGSAIHRLEKFHAVARIEAFIDWPKSDLQKLLDDIFNGILQQNAGNHYALAVSDSP